MRYKLRTGSLAWLVHRATGIALTLYIFVHLYVLSHLKNPARYESLMGLMRTPLVKLGEAGLLGLVVAHALNGIRLTLIDLGAPTGLQKLMFKIAVASGILIIVFGALPLIGGGR